MNVTVDDLQDQLRGHTAELQGFITERLNNLNLVVEPEAEAQIDRLTNIINEQVVRPLQEQYHLLQQDRAQRDLMGDGIEHCQDALQMQQGLSAGAGLRPKQFSGKDSENGRLWLDKFLAYVNFANIPNARKCAALQLSLSDGAESWFLSQAQETRENWDDILRAFRERYVEQNGVNIFLKENSLSARKQKPNETVEDFLLDIKSRGNALQKPEPELLRLALQGLLPEIRSIVIPHNPQAWYDLEEKAKMAELSVSLSNLSKPTNDIGKDTLMAVANSINKLSEKINDKEQLAKVNVVDNPSQSQNPQFPRVYCTYCNTNSHATYQCRFAPNQRNTMESVECWACGKRGHVRAQCHSRNRPNRRGRYGGNTSRQNIPWRAYDNPNRRDFYSRPQNEQTFGANNFPQQKN